MASQGGGVMASDMGDVFEDEGMSGEIESDSALSLFNCGWASWPLEVLKGGRSNAPH